MLEKVSEDTERKCLIDKLHAMTKSGYIERSRYTYRDGRPMEKSNVKKVMYEKSNRGKSLKKSGMDSIEWSGKRQLKIKLEKDPN